MEREGKRNSGPPSGQPATRCSNRDTSPSQAADRVKAMAMSWGLPEKLLNELTEGNATGAYTKGSVIFLQDSPGDVLFWVLSGVVRICCPVKSRERITVGFVGPGELVGFECLLDGTNRRTQAFEAHALTDCKLALMTHQRVVKALETLDRATLVRLIGHLNSMWSKVLQRSIRRLGLDFRSRLFEVLVDLSARFGVRDARGVMLIPELHHGDFAEMVGCSRPAVTKFFEQMMADGIA
jgi:CRP/FNR family cyclic AMP-dependent transcriptional regulator